MTLSTRHPERISSQANITRKNLFEVLGNEMRLRNYSHKTMKAYRSCIRSFVKYFLPKHPRELTNEDVRAYLLHLLVQEKRPAGTVNQVFNALRFLYSDLYKRPFVIETLPRPRKERKLPDVLNEREVVQIFQSVSNVKHRTMLMMTYACGLRVSEVVRLRIEDIDAQRGLIHLRDAKGGKDRFTILPQSLRSTLHHYWKTFQLGQSGWLFPGITPDKHLSERSIQAVFARSLEAAGIHKPVSMHTLRYTFATHLLEHGTDLRHIQKLLGHQSTKTTEIYTHISKKQLGKIKSPMDYLLDEVAGSVTTVDPFGLLEDKEKK